jgi:hypothetical protein
MGTTKAVWANIQPSILALMLVAKPAPANTPCVWRARSVNYPLTRVPVQPNGQVVSHIRGQIMVVKSSGPVVVEYVLAELDIRARLIEVLFDR